MPEGRKLSGIQIAFIGVCLLYLIFFGMTHHLVLIEHKPVFVQRIRPGLAEPVSDLAEIRGQLWGRALQTHPLTVEALVKQGLLVCDGDCPWAPGRPVPATPASGPPQPLSEPSRTLDEQIEDFVADPLSSPEEPAATDALERDRKELLELRTQLVDACGIDLLQRPRQKPPAKFKHRDSCCKTLAAIVNAPDDVPENRMRAVMVMGILGPALIEQCGEIIKPPAE